MSEDFRDGVKQAIANFYKRNETSSQPTDRRSNQKPEAQLRSDILLELKKKGFLILYVESQAVFSQSAGRFVQSHLASGTSDLIGIDHEGHFLALELKAPGRISTLKDHQRDFLHSVIDRNGFACCIDSIDSFFSLYNSWLKLSSKTERIELLKNALPKKRQSKQDSEPLFRME